MLSSPFKSKSRLEAENAALRHQLIVLRRKMLDRPRLTNNDRRFFIQIYRWFPSILQVLTITSVSGQSGGQFGGPESSLQIRSLADSITTTSESRFSAHTMMTFRGVFKLFNPERRVDRRFLGFVRP